MAALAVLGTRPDPDERYEGIDRVDQDVVEAARGMGMTGRQILRRIELPLAIPLLFTGIRISAVTIVATATIAAVAGGGGLGDIIVNQASYRLSGVLGASICVMALSARVFLALAGIQSRRNAQGAPGTSVPVSTLERSSSDSASTRGEPPRRHSRSPSGSRLSSAHSRPCFARPAHAKSTSSSDDHRSARRTSRRSSSSASSTSRRSRRRASTSPTRRTSARPSSSRRP